MIPDVSITTFSSNPAVFVPVEERHNCEAGFAFEDHLKMALEENTDEGFTLVEDHLKMAIEENTEEGFTLVNVDEANEEMLHLQASQLAQRWGVSRQKLAGYFAWIFRSTRSWTSWLMAPIFGSTGWERLASQTITNVLAHFRHYEREVGSTGPIIAQLETVLEDVSERRATDPLAISRQIIEITTKFFQESNHASKEVKYALAIQSLKEVMDVRNSSKLDFTLRDFHRTLEAMKDTDEVKVLFSRLSLLLEPERACIVSIREDYKEILGILDRLALVAQKNPFEQPVLDEVFYRLLKVRWLGTNFGGHLEGLVRLFTNEESTISLSDAPDRILELDQKIESADPRRLGKPRIALLKQCLEGELGIKYYTVENVPMVSNKEILRSQKEIVRYRAGCPTIGGSYLNALLKIASFGQTALGDQIAPNFKALIHYMREKDEHILFTVHQTSARALFGDESERVRQIFALGQTYPNFHVVIQSLCPRKGSSYVVPFFERGERKQADLLLERLAHVQKEQRPFDRSGIYIPNECRDYDYQGLIEWIHRDIFDAQIHYSEEEWLAFMMVFYELQKLVVKEELLTKGVNLVATTDPCKDDLDRGGSKWLTEMLLFGISTGQIEDPTFLNYVKSVFLGRPILVKKIGVHPRWFGPGKIILEKCTEKRRFHSIRQKMLSMQTDPVVEIAYPKEQPLFFKQPRQVVNTAELDLFWTHHQVVKKSLSAEDFQEIYIGDFKRSSLDKDAPRISVFIDGQKREKPEKAALAIRQFFQKNIPGHDEDLKKQAYLEEICTQTLFSGKPMKTLVELTPQGFFYQSSRIELRLDSTQEGVLQRVVFMPIAIGCNPTENLSVSRSLVMEIFAPYDPRETGYYTVQVDSTQDDGKDL